MPAMCRLLPDVAVGDVQGPGVVSVGADGDAELPGGELLEQREREHVREQALIEERDRTGPASVACRARW
jgi:hypothetical protein